MSTFQGKILTCKILNKKPHSETSRHLIYYHCFKFLNKKPHSETSRHLIYDHCFKFFL